MWLSPGLAHDVRAAAAESAHEKVLEKGFTHETPTPPLLQDGVLSPSSSDAGRWTLGAVKEEEAQSPSPAAGGCRRKVSVRGVVPQPSRVQRPAAS